MTAAARQHANLALALSFEFQKYLVQHPAVAKRIPRNATIIFQLDGNPRFNRRAIAIAHRQAGRKRHYLTVRIASMTPRISRIRTVELVG